MALHPFITAPLHRPTRKISRCRPSEQGTSCLFSLLHLPPAGPLDAGGPRLLKKWRALFARVRVVQGTKLSSPHAPRRARPHTHPTHTHPPLPVWAAAGLKQPRKAWLALFPAASAACFQETDIPDFQLGLRLSSKFHDTDVRGCGGTHLCPLGLALGRLWLGAGTIWTRPRGRRRDVCSRSSTQAKPSTTAGKRHTRTATRLSTRRWAPG